MVKIENVRLVPNISVGGYLESDDKQNIYWISDEGSGGARENLNISACEFILIDKLSSTALLSSDETAGIRMLHFLNGDIDKFVEYLFNEHGEGFDKNITGPYIQFNCRPNAIFKEQEQYKMDLDEATINVLDAFAKVPLMAKDLLSHLRGEPQNLRRPRGIKKSKGIPVNPWIMEKPLKLPASRIKFTANLEYDTLPTDLLVKATMIYNSGGKLIKSDEDRADFWRSVLFEQEESEEEKESSYISNSGDCFVRIEKDLNRLGERDQVILDRLNIILQEYCKYDPEVGYVQGMSDLALPFAKLYSDHLVGLKCFKSLMKRLRNNFLDSPDHGISYQLTQLRDLINDYSPLLSDYLKFNRDSDNLFFAYRWLLILFRREFPSEEADRLWDVMLAAEAAKMVKIEDFRVYMALAMILMKKPVFMETCTRFEDLLKVT